LRAAAAAGKGTAYKAAVKSDLRNLAMAQDAVLRRQSALRLQSRPWRIVSCADRRQRGGAVRRRKSYRAIGWHVNLPDTRCGIWAGVAPADGMHGAKEGVPLCWKEQ